MTEPLLIFASECPLKAQSFPGERPHFPRLHSKAGRKGCAFTIATEEGCWSGALGEDGQLAAQDRHARHREAEHLHLSGFRGSRAPDSRGRNGGNSRGSTRAGACFRGVKTPPCVSGASP